ncbi:hypothetical protein ACHAXR_010814 [Thalassiosira sp. AJA248-18]
MTFLFYSVEGTEDQCHLDCRSSDRPVGPTRPWHATDPLQNPLHLTPPYPYHIGANDEHIYEFPEFCKLGCTYFFVSSESEDMASGRTTLGQCIDQCDVKYNYNSSTPPYNDLAEMARLECRDGCLMALKRCQPGYYCLQVSFNDDDVTYVGGDMIPCPAGTYRDVSYEAVTECTPCPPNYFREDIKGRSISSCSPCRAGTSAVNMGSTSIKDCVRCPAGTFSTEASFCMCITPQACAEEQLPPPADAEKKNTVPYIGRW